jgi:hypothetical protein
VSNPRRAIAFFVFARALFAQRLTLRKAIVVRAVRFPSTNQAVGSERFRQCEVLLYFSDFRTNRKLTQFREPCSPRLLLSGGLGCHHRRQVVA